MFRICRPLWALVLGSVALSLCCWTVRFGSAKERITDSPRTAPFVHAVIFYLKPDAPSGEADALLADCHAMLSTIPTVRELRAGAPAEKEKADNAKKDYEVGLLVLFDDLKGLETYIDHPQHKEFVAKHGKFIDREKLGVYDFMDHKK
jgi:hypothetical protein